MKIAFPSLEFDYAVAAVCHGLASDEQARALNELLRYDPRARDEYILRVELHSRLASQHDLFAQAESAEAATAARGSFPFPNRDARHGSPSDSARRKLLRVAALAACFLLMVAAAVWRWPLLRRSPHAGEKSVVAAAAGSDWKPSSANLPGQEYPRINAEGRAQFRVKAPEAQDVSVNMGQPLTVTRSDDGVWTITTSPLGIGFHFYQLIIDGRSVPDPATQIFRGGGGEGFSSGVEVPTGEGFHEQKNVPHGEVREQRYFSQTTNDSRRIFVYTPPGYERETSARFPVLYLLPGAGEDETVWAAQGRASQILDNLIAEKKAAPMLAVMAAGTARIPGEPDENLMSVTDSSRRYATLDDVFVNDLIPMIDGTYRTIADGDHRALAGLSLGGAQAFAIVLRHPELFTSLGGFSGGSGAPIRTLDPRTAYGGVMADAAAFNKKTRLLFLSVGSDEPEWMLSSVEKFHEALRSMGINHQFYESPGTDHEWHTWRRSLREFASLLFKE